jgi:hypothetical protein
VETIKVLPNRRGFAQKKVWGRPETIRWMKRVLST